MMYDVNLNLLLKYFTPSALGDYAAPIAAKLATPFFSFKMWTALISPIFVSHWLVYSLTGGDKMEKIVDENLSVSISCRGLWAAETGAHCFVSNGYQRAWLNCCVWGNSLIDGKQHCVLTPLQTVIVSRMKPKILRCPKKPLTSRL